MFCCPKCEDRRVRFIAAELPVIATEAGLHLDEFDGAQIKLAPDAQAHCVRCHHAAPLNDFFAAE